MELAVIYTRASFGVEAPLVTIEVHLSNGLPAFHLVGLPEASVKESKDRVRSALINSGFDFPSKRITVNMAPADLPKGGGRFDLAIAIGIIAASCGFKNGALERYEFIGELALSGKLRSVPGILAMAIAAQNDRRTVVLPFDNQQEAMLVKSANVIAAKSLWEIYLHLTEKKYIAPSPVTDFRDTTNSQQAFDPSSAPTRIKDHDIANIMGQHHAKRALLIAAAGRHNLLLFGPAGTGKSMLASSLTSILPPLAEKEALECASIRSISGEKISAENFFQPPYRQPHHSSTAVALVGGGIKAGFGEITRAHHGVLFLDELAEFKRDVLDVLREPLETGEVHISRARHSASYPAQFQLVAAMNPSPTGDINDGRSSSEQVLRYLNKISGPLLDRIDLQVHVPRVSFTQTASSDTPSITSETLHHQVIAAQQTQHNRQGMCNSMLSGSKINAICYLNKDNERFLNQAIEALGLSMRAYHRTLRVARTIADLECTEQIQKTHLAEALGFRNFDKLIRSLSQ